MTCFPEFCRQKGYFRSPEWLQAKGSCEKVCVINQKPLGFFFRYWGLKRLDYGVPHSEKSFRQIARAWENYFLKSFGNKGCHKSTPKLSWKRVKIVECLQYV